MPRDVEHRSRRTILALAGSIAVLLVPALVAACGRPPEPAAEEPPLVAAWGTVAPSTATPGFPSPSAGATPSGGAAVTPTASAPARRVPAPSHPEYRFPVQTGNVDYHTTHSGYPATDIFANCGSPVVAVTDGRILEVSRVDRFHKGGVEGPFNGGKSVSLLGDDGVRYYGSHLVEVTAGIEAGVRVRAGQRLGSVGHTGNANNVCHLHFGISPPCAGTADWWIRRGVIWPATFLDAWHKGSDKSAVSTVAAWRRSHGCPKAP